MQTLHWHPWFLLFVANCFSLPLANVCCGEEATAEEQHTPKPVLCEDPYEVPHGSIDKLTTFIRDARQRCRPRSLLEMRRLHRSLDQAAKEIFASPQASSAQRLQAANLRVKLLSRQRHLGMKQAGRQLDDFLGKMGQDRSPEVQALARFTALDHSADRWRWLSHQEKTRLIDDLSAELENGDLQQRDIALMIKVANAASDSADADAVAKMIEQALPKCEASQNQAIAAQLPWLTGVGRRLRLPGEVLELEGDLLQGGKLDWQAYRGQYVVVCYWATWSRPSLAEVESIKAAFDAYHEQGFEVLGICLDADRTDALRYVQQRKIPWPTLCNPSPQPTRWNHPMACKYAIGTIPRTILVDDQGAVLHMNLRGKQLHKTLARLLSPEDNAKQPRVAEVTASGKTVSTEP